MNINIESLKPYLLFIPIAILQVTVIPVVSINGVIPDLVILSLVYFTLRLGRMWGLIAAAVTGAFLDLMTGNALGSAVIAQSIAIYLTGLFYKDQISDNYVQTYYFALIVLLGGIINSLVFSFVAKFELSGNLLSTIFSIAFLPGIYTAFIALFISIVHPKRSSF